MKTLLHIIESLLDDGFDITDDTILTSRLCTWIENAKTMGFADASLALFNIMKDIPEALPMKRQQLAEDNVVVSWESQDHCYISFIYRGRHACYSHITFNWTTTPKPNVSAGKFNLVEVKNKRKHSRRKVWVLPAKAFDELYKSAI